MKYLVCLMAVMAIFGVEAKLSDQMKPTLAERVYVPAAKDFYALPKETQSAFTTAGFKPAKTPVNPAPKTEPVQNKEAPSVKPETENQKRPGEDVATVRTQINEIKEKERTEQTPVESLEADIKKGV